MIDNYNLNIGMATHTIRATLMCNDYIGHIAYKVSGNCKGIDVIIPNLDIFDENDINKFVENDCEFKLHYGNYFTVVLTNSKGDKCEIEGDEDEIYEMIVALEIVNVERDDNESN